MDIKHTIKQAVTSVETGNVKSMKKYQQRLLDTLQTNLNKATDKKKAVKDNQGLITRYKSAQPKQLTQMQQALLGAAV